MKILLLADEAEPTLWEYLNRAKLEGVDLILSCGDLPASYLSFLTCFTNAPILYVHGNHDDRYASQPPEGCICVEDTVYTHNGLRILGLGGSMRYNNGINQYTEKDMEKRIRKMRWKLFRSGGFDVLLAHSPAFQLGDDTDRAHTGFVCFRTLMDKYHPRYFFHGHVHQNYRFDFKRTREYNDTAIINAFRYYIIDIPDPPYTR